MISFINTSAKMTDRQIGSAAMLGATTGSFQGTGVSVAAPVQREQLLVQACAVRPASAAKAPVYARPRAAEANGAGFPNALHLPKTWAFRGLEPWRDPA
ncbi:hypothetical protein GCM10010218_57310 [Streptomyces mashuensis]|uniref:Uncharacterized protein n=1 Tax=Streptomyces mashuensis TaxID=33904 RepID=A0A919B9U2_9ACTN|nr:hypothetical protein [Streptomyces mashuensis]GHF68436.1 hypothetical protein GCM10010218_57310 [Streptomyces mashuensis]